MRSKNALRNTVFSLGYELFIFVIGLIIPRLIIVSYGDAVNGLTQTINKLLTLIQLIQAGAVGASIYQMYKPVADEDYMTQSEILYSSGKYFKKLGVIYLSLAVAISIPYGFYLSDDALSSIEIILSFIILAVNGTIHFFFTSRYDIFFSAHQKRYYLIISSIVERVVYYVLLFLVVSGKLHFMFMHGALLCSGVIRTVVNGINYRKLAKGKIEPKPRNKNYPIRGRMHLMLNSIGTQMVTAAPMVIITTFEGLVSSSVFSIYSMIYTSLKTIINSIQLSVSAIFGNYVSKSNDKDIARIFNILVCIFVLIGTMLASCTAFLIMPFIEIYTEGLGGANYINPLLGIFIVAYVVVFSIRIVYGFVSTVYGLFKEICKLTLTYGIVCVCISAVLTALFGMSYVMVGIILFHTLYTISLLVILKKRIPWFTTNKLPVRLLMMCSLPTLSYFLYKINLVEITSFISWVLVAVVYGIIMLLVLWLYCMLFERQEVFVISNYLRNSFMNRKNRT